MDRAINGLNDYARKHEASKDNERRALAENDIAKQELQKTRNDFKNINLDFRTKIEKLRESTLISYNISMKYFKEEASR